MKKAVVAIVINPVDKNILCVSRKDDQWDCNLPGGKVDPGELVKDALIREVKEETGLDIVDSKPVYIETQTEFKVYYFLCTLKDYTLPEVQKETGKVEFTHPSNLLRGKFSKSNLAILKAIGYVL